MKYPEYQSDNINILWIFIFITVFLSSCGMPNPDQNKIYQLMDLRNYSYQLFSQGKYNEAENRAKEALQYAEKEFGPGTNEVISCLSNMGDFYLAQGRYTEAELYYTRALETVKKNPYLNISGPGKIPDRALVSSLSDLADLFLIQEKYAEAAPLYEEALELFKGQPRSIPMWNILEKLDRCYRKSGNADKTENIGRIRRRFREGK